MQREYVVALNRDVDYDTFWNEMESQTNGLLHIPDRIVEIVNNRDGSTRSCHYSLTDEEAQLLANDPRVYCVEIPADQRTDIKIGIRSSATGNFNKPFSSATAGANLNWGLKRISNPTNVYGTGVASPSSNYDYILDGTGVDVVIQDSGIEADHPEFTNSQGISRLQKIDWYTASGISGTQSANHYRDYDGHGTHVAGIAVGKNYGWARNANIYSVKVSGLEGAGDSGTGISISNCFDVIKLWHRNKPVDPVTGAKRPTIVNASWGYSATFNRTDITSMTYRGNNYSGTAINTYQKKWALGLVPVGTIVSGPDIGVYTTSVRINSVDVDVQELIDEGVQVCIAAGNSYNKIDNATGPDYNNYVSATSGTYYYHRGSSPLDDECIKVGCIDSSVYSAELDQKADFSCSGDGIDIWCPGANITSCTSNINKFGNVTYNNNSAFKQITISGTSQASPQVCGLSALYLQTNPKASPRTVKQWVTNVASVSGVIYTTNTQNNYTNYRDTLSNKNRVLFNPFAKSSDQTISGGLTLTNGVITLT
jgi:subtilisin family serine protease